MLVNAMFIRYDNKDVKNLVNPRFGGIACMIGLQPLSSKYKKVSKSSAQ